jgi:hypothetical protein
MDTEYGARSTDVHVAVENLPADRDSDSNKTKESKLPPLSAYLSAYPICLRAGAGRSSYSYGQN